MDAIDVIRAKRDGHALSPEQISFFIRGYTDGAIPDEQAAALLMAIVWRGMESRELITWTDEMIESGRRVDLSAVTRPTVDKHSTGGVGDKVSLILGPLVAACGAAVPMMSGRGLGHTGGTLDKLETIPGFRVELTEEEIVAIVNETGCVIYAAGDGIAPADRRLYALRDVTGTVEAIPLIASSIMSKKIAEGTDSLVLDVKVGSGAFLPEIAAARELAATMIELGYAHGVTTSALLTDMNTPLGRRAGNALEVVESVETLRGDGPDDLVEVTLGVAEEMLTLSGIDRDPRDALADGSAYECYRAMVKAQGGDPDAELPTARERTVVTAPVDGFVTRLDARAVGIAAWRLGAGRRRKDDPVGPSAGVVCIKKPGDAVVAGEPVLELHADDAAMFAAAIDALRDAIEVGPEPTDQPPRILERIGR